MVTSPLTVDPDVAVIVDSTEVEQRATVVHGNSLETLLKPNGALVEEETLVAGVPVRRNLHHVRLVEVVFDKVLRALRLRVDEEAVAHGIHTVVVKTFFLYVDDVVPVAVERHTLIGLHILKEGQGVLFGRGTMLYAKKNTLTVSEVSNNLRGVPGTEVVLELEREGVKKPFKVSIIREDIHLDAVSYATVFKADSLSEPVAYIAFNEFTEGSAQAFSNTLDDLYYTQGARKLIIDLRGNGGGIVDEAMQIVNLFVDRDVTIVETRGKSSQSNRTYKTRNTPRYKELPIVILVDKNSASASEIVSGALQDLGRAKLIGQRTFGKGLVQNLRPIAYGGHLKVTTSKYYLPSGRCIQAIDYSERQKGHELKKDTAGGILPDIVLNDSAKVDICYTLYVNNYFFDYATRYHRLHDSIASPLLFELSDADIEDFCHYLDERKFRYETETSKYFADMIKMAKHEDIDSAVVAQLEALEPVLTPDFREAIARNKEEVKEMLGAEIVLRYYYQKGQAAYQLRFDEELHRSLHELR